MMRPNAAPAVLAIVLAIFLWIYVRLVYGGPDTSRMLLVPVNLKGTPPAGFDVQLHPDSGSIRIGVKGRENVVKELLPQDVRAVVDVAHVNTARVSGARSNIQAEAIVSGPDGVTVLPMVKPTLVVTRLVQDQFRVKVSFIVSPPVGTTVGSYELEPDTVTVEARSQQELDAIKYVTVAVDPTIPLTKPRSLEPQAITVENKPSTQVRILTPSVEVRAASLTGEQTTRRVAVRPPELRNRPAGFDVKVDKVRPDEVTLSGDPANLARQPAYLETEPLDVSKLRRDETRTVRLKVPDGLRVVEGMEVRVDLQVTRRD
ncbi:MAG: YbbR-like protein [bacterium ADurb.Bin429]|nr:MAG: YbbR-like protein [bacterium ADurb.Bin429]